MENKTKELYKELGTQENIFDRVSILSILYTRIAAALENQEISPQAIGASDPSKTWERANHYLAELSELDPQKAFELSIDLTLLPKNEDGKKELVNRWIRTSGLSLLGLEQNKNRLIQYLQNGKHKDLLVKTLESNIQNDISDLETAEDLRNPKGFTTVQSVYIALGLESGLPIFESATKRKLEPDFAHIAGIIKEFPDCQYLKNRL